MAQESSWWICGPSVSLPAKIWEVLQNWAGFSTWPMCTSATGACFLNTQALLHHAKLWPHSEGPWVKKWYLLGRTCQNKLADFGDENAWRHFAAMSKLAEYSRIGFKPSLLMFASEHWSDFPEYLQPTNWSGHDLRRNLRRGSNSHRHVCVSWKIWKIVEACHTSYPEFMLSVNVLFCTSLYLFLSCQEFACLKNKLRIAWQNPSCRQPGLCHSSLNSQQINTGFLKVELSGARWSSSNFTESKRKKWELYDFLC